MSTQHPLRILSIEDDPKDTELIQDLLEIEGIVCEVTRVDTEALLRDLIKPGGIDLILADYSLPSFDGVSALKLATKACPDVPFIFVSGTLGEEVAIEALKIGATDYVLKTRLSRLVPSVLRALREATQRAERKRVEEALRQSETYLAEGAASEPHRQLRLETFHRRDHLVRGNFSNLPIRPNHNTDPGTHSPAGSSG